MSFFLFPFIHIYALFYMFYLYPCFIKCGQIPNTRTLFSFCNYFSAIKGLFCFLQF
jgi:hypothetical protein